MPSLPAIPPATVLTVAGVGKSYGEQRVLSDVSFTLRAGERLALTGPSGGGKTTLLNCIGGVDQPDEGTIRLGEVELTRLSSDGLAAVRRRQIGTIFQFFHLLPTLSAYENIELPLQLLGVGEPERAARAGELVRRVGLTHRSAALPSQLSGGEQQRVAIARALVHRPALLLADEPTGNLDSANGAKILALLRELTDESGVALVLVTHSEEAATLCHRRLSVRDGRIAGGP
jgi:ABC-type lipoprotein export system ATPase subunit